MAHFVCTNWSSLASVIELPHNEADANFKMRSSIYASITAYTSEAFDARVYQ